MLRGGFVFLQSTEGGRRESQYQRRYSPFAGMPQRDALGDEDRTIDQRGARYTEDGRAPTLDYAFVKTLKGRHYREGPGEKSYCCLDPSGEAFKRLDALSGKNMREFYPHRPPPRMLGMPRGVSASIMYSGSAAMASSNIVIG